MSNDSKSISIFSAKACAAPLDKAAALYEERTGTKIQVAVCSRHCAKPVAEEAVGTTGGDDFLLEIAEGKIHDLAISGAEYLFDDGEIRGIIAKKQRRTIAYRTSAIVVPKDNPKNLQTLEDLTQPGIRIGISVIDCLKGVWEDAAGRAGLMEPIRNNITYYANGCVAIMEAVASDEIDVAIGWTAFQHLDTERTLVIEMPEEYRVLRGTCVGMLSFAKDPELAKDFMNFLASPDAQKFYIELGWVVPEN